MFYIFIIVENSTLCPSLVFLMLILAQCFYSDQQSFLEELERTVALLAFEDVSNCPVGELLDISQRLKTASEVNAAILTSQSHEKGLCSLHLFVLGHEFNLVTRL